MMHINLKGVIFPFCGVIFPFVLASKKNFNAFALHKPIIRLPKPKIHC